VVVLTAAVAVACSDESTGPDADLLTIEITAGDGQLGVEGWPVLTPPTVRVTDATGAPRADAPVTFEVLTGGGTVSSSMASTGLGGNASAVWRLGAPTVRTQEMRASLPSGAGSVTFTATSLSPGESDYVIVLGALGPLRGIVVTREQPQVEIVAARTQPDTLIPVPPVDLPSLGLVVFGSGNRPRHVAPAWTGGVDTVHVALEPPVVVDLDVDIRDGTFEVRQQDLEAQLRELEGIIDEESLGIEIGDVTYIDNTGGGPVSLSSAGICAGPVPADAIQITVVSAIDNGAYTGWGCWSGRIYLSAAVRNVPHLLAHELGHTFTLEHTFAGLMRSTNPQRVVHEGEIYRAHFHAQSALNTIFGSQPEADRRNCSVLGVCLPESLDLGPG